MLHYDIPAKTPTDTPYDSPSGTLSYTPSDSPLDITGDMSLGGYPLMALLVPTQFYFKFLPMLRLILPLIPLDT